MEMTRPSQKCAELDQGKEGYVAFKSNTTGENMAGMTVDSGAAQTAYMPIGGFTEKQLILAVARK